MHAANEIGHKLDASIDGYLWVCVEMKFITRNKWNMLLSFRSTALYPLFFCIAKYETAAYNEGCMGDVSKVDKKYVAILAGISIY